MTDQNYVSPLPVSHSVYRLLSCINYHPSFLFQFAHNYNSPPPPLFVQPVRMVLNCIVDILSKQINFDVCRCCFRGQVRNLEAQNRKLADELDKLKTKWGKETAQIKAMFQAELDEARRALDEAEKEKARLEIKVASLEEQIEELRLK